MVKLTKQQSRAAQDVAMSELSLTLALHFKTSKIINDMAKVSIKSKESLLLEEYFT